MTLIGTPPWRGAPCVDALEQAAQVVAHGHWRRFTGFAIVDAQAAADVEVVQHDAFGVQGVDQFDQAVERFEQRRVVEQLRTDVAIDAGHLQVRQRGGAAVGRQRVVEGHAELVGFQTRRDVGVGLGVDVGVHAQRHARDLAHAAGDLVQAVQLGNRFDVEAQDVVRQRQAHFLDALADARKNHFARIAAGCEHAQQFAARDDVEAGALAREQVEDRQVGIGLHRVADECVAPRASVGVGAEIGQQRRLRIHIGGRAELRGDAGQGGAFGVQHAGVVREMRHGRISTKKG